MDGSMSRRLIECKRSDRHITKCCRGTRS